MPTREDHEHERLTPELVLVCPELRDAGEDCDVETAEAAVAATVARSVSPPPAAPDDAPAPLAELDALPRKRRRGGPRFDPRKLLRAIVFAGIFFAGAALSAGAGDKVATLIETTSGEVTGTDATAAAPTAATTSFDVTTSLDVTTSSDATTSADATTAASTPTSSTETAAATETTAASKENDPPAEKALARKASKSEETSTTTATEAQPQDRPREVETGAPAETSVARSENGAPAETSVASRDTGQPTVTAGADAEAAAAETGSAPAPSLDATAGETGIAPRANEAKPATVTEDEDTTKERRPGKAKAAKASAAKAQGRRPHASQARRARLTAAARDGGFIDALAGELEVPGGLLGPLPDATPPGLRLDPDFAKLLSVTSAREGIDWALLLGVLRARNADELVQPRAAAVRETAKRLAALGARRNPSRAALKLSRSMSVAEKAIALQRYNRAVGLDALVSGLQAAKPVLTARVLRDPRLEIYPGGRSDVAAGKIDVRVLVLMLYLAEANGEVRVSSLVSGHRLYARPGAISAHVYGLALDVSALGGVSIAGNQEPGGVTEGAVRQILLLPAEVAPQQVISLLDLGGASFALADHRDHIHVGYAAGGPGAVATPAADLRKLWQSAGARYGVPWQILAAINKIESNFGRNMGPSSAGAIGWMQFMPSTWQRWGVDADGNGIADPWNAEDAIHSAARYLEGAGGREDLARAIFAYNHAQWYVDDVLEQARLFEER